MTLLYTCNLFLACEALLYKPKYSHFSQLPFLTTQQAGKQKLLQNLLSGEGRDLTFRPHKAEIRSLSTRI